MALWNSIVGFVAKVLKYTADLLNMTADSLLHYSAPYSIERPIPPLNLEATRKSDKNMENLLFQILFCPEILEAIFKNLDTGRLKKCRLVCKAWNQEICQSLTRDKWVASLSGKEALSEFKAFLETRREQQSQLPLPFRNISFGAKCSLASSCCLWLGDYALLQITKLDLSRVTYYESIVKGDRVEFLLRTYSNTLTYLRASFWIILEHENSRAAASLEFPVLKELQVLYNNDFNYSRSVLLEKAAIIQRIISGAPNLSSLSIWGMPFASEILREVRDKNNNKLSLSSLKTLEVFFGNDHRTETTTYRLLRENSNFRNVSHLSIGCRLYGEAEQLNHLHQTLATFAAQLKSLSIGDGDAFSYSRGVVDQIIIRFPTFPQLTALNLNACCVKLVDLRSFPQLRHLVCRSVEAHVRGEQDPRGYSPNVQRVSIINRIVGTKSKEAPSDEQESTFSALFSNFPNARAWSINHSDAVSFCRAALSSGFQVNSLVILWDGREGDDVEKLAHDDRFIFSYVELLKDLETLVLVSWCFTAPEEFHVKMLDPKGMEKLKNLVVSSRFGPKLDNYRNLVREGLKVTVVASSKGVNGNEGILSGMGNFEFHSDSSAYYQKCPYLDDWWDHLEGDV